MCTVRATNNDYFKLSKTVDPRRTINILVYTSIANVNLSLENIIHTCNAYVQCCANINGSRSRLIRHQT